jgi:guanylate kinase
MTSVQIDTIIEAIRTSEKTYQPSLRTVETLKQKTLVMLVGPVAIGKSYLIGQVSAIDPEFKQVSVFTTRDQRPDDDPALFRILPHTNKTLFEIQNKIQQGDLVQFTVHPTTGRIYGTEPQNFSVRYNLLPMLASAIDDRIQKPFARAHILFIVARPEIWKRWLDTRYPVKSEERTKRIQEAIISLKWALAENQPYHITWIENSVENPERTIEDITNIVKYNQQDTDSARDYGRQMLELAIKENEE